MTSSGSLVWPALRSPRSLRRVPCWSSGGKGAQDGVSSIGSLPLTFNWQTFPTAQYELRRETSSLLVSTSRISSLILGRRSFLSTTRAKFHSGVSVPATFDRYFPALSSFSCLSCLSSSTTASASFSLSGAALGEGAALHGAGPFRANRGVLLRLAGEGRERRDARAAGALAVDDVLAVGRR